MPVVPGTVTLNRTHASPGEGVKAGRLTLPQRGEVTDAIDDLQEIRFVIHDLIERLSHLESTEEQSTETDSLWHRQQVQGLRQWLRTLQIRQVREMDRLGHAASCSESRRLCEILEGSRLEALKLKAACRTAYKQLGTLLNLSDWQTPVYSSSYDAGVNRLGKDIYEHVLDYKRDGHLDQVPYEVRFANQCTQHLGSNSARAYLANCGMAAYTTALQWLAHEAGFNGQVLALEPMYFENLHLASGFFPELKRVSGKSGQALETILRALQPKVVLLDAVTNCNDMVAHDLETVRTWAAASTQPVALVIDTTCFPVPLMRDGFLAGLPEHVVVMIIESLAKYHQLGMDTVTGGITILHAPEALHNDYKKTRARLGTNITDAASGALPSCDREVLSRRMVRHSRNTELLARKLEEALDAGLMQSVESISWLESGVDGCNWYKGTCLNLRFKPALRSKEIYREFEEHAVTVARRLNYNLALSTSFGFDTTRLYVTAPGSIYEPPFLRISVGTEQAAQIETLLQILIRSDNEIATRYDARIRAFEKSPVQTPGTVQSTGATRKAPARSVTASVFSGKNALKEYLDPAHFAPSPLVELPDDLNPFATDGIRLFAKVMPIVPLLNVKSIPAFSMIARAAERGDLDNVNSLIESSSSNTVLSLSVIARLFGIEQTNALVDHAIAPALVRMLQLFGVDVHLHPGPGHELYGKIELRSQRANREGCQPGWFNPNQYANKDNPEAFARWLAPDLLAQTQGNLKAFSCGLGTCGTMYGVSKPLRNANPDTEIIACAPAAGQPIPGPRELSQLSDVRFPWDSVPTRVMEVSSKDGFESSVRLLRRGIMGGPSSGMNYAGLIRHLEELKDKGELSRLTSQELETWCVFLCCDSPLQHVDEYFDELGESYFPPVHPVPNQK